MAQSFCSCRNAPPRSRLGIAIQMLLGTSPNKKLSTKQCMKSSPHHSFCQVHGGRLLDDDKFCMDLFFQVQASRPESIGQQEMWRSLWYIWPALPILIITCLQLCFFVIGSAFVGTSLNIGRTRQSKIFYLGSSSKFFFKGVLGTKRFLWILSRAKKVYNWASYLEHLQSIKFDIDRAPGKFDLIWFFQKRRQPLIKA